MKYKKLPLLSTLYSLLILFSSLLILFSSLLFSSLLISPSSLFYSHDNNMLLRDVENFKRKLQENRYAKIWVIIALFFFGGASFLLSKVRRFRWDVPYHRLTSQKQRGVVFFWIVVSVFSILHICVWCLTPWIRSWRCVRRTPSFPMMAFGCAVTIFIPLACSMDGSLTDETSDKNSLGATLCFMMDFFCLHMSILPAFDYMIVHVHLGIVGTIVLGMTRDILPVKRLLWVVLSGFCTWMFLTFHHWLTTPSVVMRIIQPIVHDTRVSDPRIISGEIQLLELPAPPVQPPQPDIEDWRFIPKIITCFMVIFVSAMLLVNW
ncbi:uncharacterized protein [Spinacia oleracea]|uniref:Transmembrane protein n=1 Tax=Spinacia oleracea TaxID=3562 RepID=A0ABM3RDF4_SPIOL|nr:uncharacterized protein LOC130468078 [Spinacia oleracea]